MDQSLIIATINDGDVIGIASQAVWTAMQVSAPMLLVGLVVGLVIAIFQAVTQIQEQTLVFVPKIIAIVAAMVVTGPWMLHMMMDYTEGVFKSIPTVVASGK
jgi:flagellar biosynthetic protein FliQ